MRFVSSEIDKHSHVSAGLFCAAFRLLDEMALSDHEYSAVRDLIGWFNVNLRVPLNIDSDRNGALHDQFAGSGVRPMNIWPEHENWPRSLTTEAF